MLSMAYIVGHDHIHLDTGIYSYLMVQVTMVLFMLIVCMDNAL